MCLSAQNLIVNLSFDEDVDEQIYSAHLDSDGWFLLDWNNGATKIRMVTADEKHGKAIELTSTNDNTWYKAYLGQKVSVKEKGVYVLSFDAMAVSDAAKIRCFLRDGTDKNFFMKKGV